MKIQAAQVDGLPLASVLVTRAFPSAVGSTIGLFRVNRPFPATDSGGVDTGGVLEFHIRATQATIIGLHQVYIFPLGLDLPGNSAGTWYRLFPQSDNYTDQITSRFEVDVRWNVISGSQQYYEFRVRTTALDTGSASVYWGDVRCKIFRFDYTFADLDTTYTATATGVTAPANLYVLNGHHHDDRYARVSSVNFDSPTLSVNGTGGFSSIASLSTAKKVQITGDLVFAAFQVNVAITSGSGTFNYIDVALPVTADAAYGSGSKIGDFVASYAGVPDYNAVCRIFSSTTLRITLSKAVTSGNTLAFNGWISYLKA